MVGLGTTGDTQFVFHDLPGLLEAPGTTEGRNRPAALEELARADAILDPHPAPGPAPAFTSLRPP